MGATTTLRAAARCGDLAERDPDIGLQPGLLRRTAAALVDQAVIGVADALGDKPRGLFQLLHVL